MKLYRCLSFFILSLVCLLNMMNVTAFAAGTNNAAFLSIEKQIEEDVKKYHIPAMAVAVVDRNSVLYEKTFGNCDSADRPFIIGSMSKSFTALAVMQLNEQGLVDLDKSIDEYIDAGAWFESNTDHGRITVKDLLNQTSGITTYQTFGSLKSTDLYGSHVYANANYGLLGLIIEAVSGMSYEQYVEQNIFAPLGMTHSAATLEKSRENGLIEGYRNFFGIPIAGEPDFPDKIHNGMWTNVPAGYLSASVTDMEKYLQMYLRGGDDIITSGSINSMFYDNVPAGDGTYYGMGWNCGKGMFNNTVLSHAGLVENYTSNMFIFPEQGKAVVVLVNMNDYLVCNNLLGNVIMPLLGGEKEELPNLYLILHIVTDLIYAAIFFISIYSALTLKKWRAKAENKRFFITDILRHIVLPAALLAIPPVLGTPYTVMWLFVKDLTIMIIINAALLIAVGIYKAIFLIRRKNHGA